MTSISRTSLPCTSTRPTPGTREMQRPDLIARDVVQRRRIAALEVVREDREERRRQPLDLDVEPGRQRRLRPGSRAPAPAAARTHVRASAKSRSISLPPRIERDCTRVTPGTTLDRFLDRPRDA